jgi:hypothetical protein
MKRVKFPQHNKTNNITAINTQLKILTDSYRLHIQIHNPKNISLPNKKFKELNGEIWLKGYRNGIASKCTKPIFSRSSVLSTGFHCQSEL